MVGAKRKKLERRLTLPRTVVAPAAFGPGAVDRIVSVVLEEDEDVIWEWTHAPDGTEFVSGYTIVPRLPLPPDDRPPVPLDLGSSGV